MAKTGLQIGIALMAFVSLQPYFLWQPDHLKLMYGVSTLIIVSSAAASIRTLIFTRERIAFSLAFTGFLVYLSVLPKTDGSITRWFFLTPFTVALLHVRPADLASAFDKFHWIFALSFLPGIAIWLWLVAGLPLEMTYTTPPSAMVSRGPIDYAEVPGALVLLSNSVVLATGGVLSRLCGVYDEPGTVGTIAALCLAASRYRLRSFPGAVSLIAGILSFSIAFALLTGLGMVLTAITEKRPRLLIYAAVSAVAGATTILGIESATVASSLSLRVEMAEVQGAPWHKPSAPSFKDGEKFKPHAQWGLRFSPLGVDNRAHPQMRGLADQFAAAPLRQQLLGIASDASVVRGLGSSVWYRVLTDFGLVGFLAAFSLFAYPPLSVWREGRLGPGIAIFVLLFLMSFYQRPIIWMPAQLLIYLFGVRYGCKSEASRAGVSDGRDA